MRVYIDHADEAIRPDADIWCQECDTWVSNPDGDVCLRDRATGMEVRFANLSGRQLIELAEVTIEALARRVPSDDDEDD
jgi:hypothetical protein